MSVMDYTFTTRQIILDTKGEICKSTIDLLNSKIFEEIVARYIAELSRVDSPLIDYLRGNSPSSIADKELSTAVIDILRTLEDKPISQVSEIFPGSRYIFSKPELLYEFVEGLYDFWRRYERFLICHSEEGPNSYDSKPFRTFNRTTEELTHLVRAAYRDICENISGDHPRVYRQVPAGCQVALIAVPKKWQCPGGLYRIFKSIPMIRQVWIDPPLIIDPPMNKRTGQFQKVDKNILDIVKIDPDEFICYPAQVGPLLIHIYINKCFIGLGVSLSNLFELASDEQIKHEPDAIYIYGCSYDELIKLSEFPAVFYDDEKAGILLAAVPDREDFGYFGYLKKMILTLHNIIMMKRSRMPFHGALVHIELRDRNCSTVLIIGDTAAGKSETLEAFRIIGTDYIRQLKIIADDMGSIEIDENNNIRGFGTEIGAFVRLDDLQDGYAFGQIDRAIIMSPQKTNARAVLPITTMNEVLRGYEIDILLYANNYEEVDDSHQVIERFLEYEDALEVFREGAALAKGTTTSRGLVHNYFANIFGPHQYKELHEKLARKFFITAFMKGIFVGQVRTRLGIEGYEIKGPEAAAKALLEIIKLKYNKLHDFTY